MASSCTYKYRLNTDRQVCVIKTVAYRARTDRQTDRQTERQTDRQTDSGTDGQNSKN